MSPESTNLCLSTFSAGKITRLHTWWFLQTKYSVLKNDFMIHLQPEVDLWIMPVFVQYCFSHFFATFATTIILSVFTDGWSNYDCDNTFPSFCVKYEAVWRMHFESTTHTDRTDRVMEYISQVLFESKCILTKIEKYCICLVQILQRN